MEEIIKVEKLTKVFDNSKTAVNRISFNVKKNSIFGILGPNGSGKTTTQRMLTTLLKPTSGTIEIEGINYSTGGYQILKDIGYVPQKDALYQNLTTWENIDFFFSAYRYDGNRKDRIIKILKDIDLVNAKDVFAKNLSGGMAKRLSIACAITHQPKIILFDEVTMGLDPVAREKIWELTKKLKENATIILTTHYMDEAEKLCDELIILRNGKIIASGSPAEIINKFKVKNLHEVMAGIKDESS